MNRLGITGYEKRRHLLLTGKEGQQIKLPEGLIIDLKLQLGGVGMPENSFRGAGTDMRPENHHTGKG